MTLPSPPSESPIAFALQRPEATPGCFWKATKWSPTFQGSKSSGLFHQIVTKPPARSTASTMVGASELATVFTNITTFLPWARIAWILEISVWEDPCESTISRGMSSFSERAFAPSMLAMKYGLVVLITDTTRTRSSLAIGSEPLVGDPPAVDVHPTSARAATAATAEKRLNAPRLFLRDIFDSFIGNYCGMSVMHFYSEN